MNKFKIVLISLVAILLLTCIGGCSAPSSSGYETEDVYYVYFGLNDADTGKQEVSMEEASAYIRGLFAKYGYGYTEHRTIGAYTENGKTVENENLVYMLVYVPEEDVKKIADEAIEHLNLASVLCQKTSMEHTFFVGAEKQAA